MTQKIKKRIKSNSAFMGLTHSTSGLMGFLLILNFIPPLASLMAEGGITFLALSCIAVIGASLIPDFDNTKSTAITALGFIGKFVSKIVRALNVFVYVLTKSKFDNKDVNPHRGFSHTIVASILLGLIVAGFSSIPVRIPLPIIGERPVGFVFAAIFFSICMKLAIASVLHKSYKKFVKSIPLCNAMLYVVIAIFTIFMFAQLPADTGYFWLGVSIATGCIIHIIGDTFTVMGTPLFFPFGKKGKRWWMWRIPPGIKAGGPIENILLIPAFLIISLLSLGFTIFNILIL